jgi:DNA-binding NarL/FixJ family response regulator
VTGSRVRVLVADNHPLYREAVAAAIRRAPGLELVADESGERSMPCANSSPTWRCST